MDTAPMLKAYVGRTWYPDKSEPDRHHLQVEFTTKAEKAAHYETRQEAENDCVAIFNRNGIAIDSSQGGKHILSNFRVEERGPKEYVVFCEGPFIVRS